MPMASAHADANDVEDPLATEPKATPTASPSALKVREGDVT